MTFPVRVCPVQDEINERGMPDIMLENREETEQKYSNDALFQY